MYFSTVHEEQILWCTVLLEKLTGPQLVKISPHLAEPMVHYRIHKRPLPAPILSHLNSVHVSPSYFLKIHFNIIFNLHLDITSGLFPSGAWTDGFCSFLISLGLSILDLSHSVQGK